VPPGTCFALGDNSYNSSDSRYFGPVPERNVVGRGFVVYWPFLGQWGLIR
jgi:signal peptidase I